jgi:geranylgeranyl diphosphate synthase type II
MLIHALQNVAPRERRKLAAFVAADRRDRLAADVRWVHALLQRGSIQHARSVAQALAGAALREFDRTTSHLPDGRDLRFMRHLLLWVVQRTH